MLMSIISASPSLWWGEGDGRPGMGQKDVEESGGSTLRAPPTPSLPSWMTVGEDVALPPEKVCTSLRGARHTQAAEATLLQLALALVTV